VVLFDEDRTRLFDGCQTMEQMCTRPLAAEFETPVAVADLTKLLHALGDPVRLELIRALAAADHPIPCGGFDTEVTKSTLSHHFRVLREAGVITQTCEGVRKLTTLRRGAVDAAYPGLLDSILGVPAGAPRRPGRRPTQRLNEAVS